MLEALREEVWRLHLELPKANLVTWTAGNLSARDPESGFVVIKPSGIRYEDLKPEHMVIVDLEGDIVEGTLKPSSDTASHLYIYRHRPDVNGVVHTHSRYATAFAALGRADPLLPDRAGRRVWRPHSLRRLCAHRRRGDRPGGDRRHRQLRRPCCSRTTASSPSAATPKARSRPQSWWKMWLPQPGLRSRSASQTKSHPKMWRSCTIGIRTFTGRNRDVVRGA